jgi:2',3'-cyclic-nucleotide 2'-phosphodiesterase (5'-nucleotidase family)
MKNTFKQLLKTFIWSFAIFAASDLGAQIQPKFLARHSVGRYFDQGAAEIVAYSTKYKRMFVTNNVTNSIHVVNISNPGSPSLYDTISLKPYGMDLTSVVCNGEFIGVTVIDSAGKLANGKVVFFNAGTLAYVSQVKVGPNPDMMVFSKDGKKVLVANEGEPLDYVSDPEGSVSIIDISNGLSSLTNSNVKIADFKAFNNVAIDSKIKITGKLVDSATKSSVVRNSTVAEDLEPEYIAISEDSRTAWVTCQENNCVAVLNLDSNKFTRLIPLGYKNHNIVGQGLDFTNQGSTISIDTVKVFGMYQPDQITSYTVKGTTYYVTANEGDLRADWGTVNNEEKDIRDAAIKLDTAKFGLSSVTLLKNSTGRGRLKVSSKYGDFNNDGKFDSLFCFGGRSFSIWNGSTGSLVYDSKNDFETITASKLASIFNASHSNNTLKNRSDDKGPEPECVTIGKILDSTYAFIGLERIGGVMIYNITDPANAYYVNYINTRNASVTPSAANLSTVGDLGPESIVFIPKSESPNGKDLLLVSNEVSGTVAIIELQSRSDFQMQILHSSDMESGVSAVNDAYKFAAIVDKLEDAHVNNLTLSSGDNTLPGPFLSSGEDPKVQVAIRATASSYYSGTTSGLRASVGRADIALMNIIGYNASALGNHEFDLGTSELNSQIGVDIRSTGTDKRWVGAQFPYVSANLNFSSDANLSYLYTSSILKDVDFKTSPSITSNASKKGIAPSIIIERNGQKIGVVGATTQILAKISSPGSTVVMGPNKDSMAALAAILQPVIDSLVIKEKVNKIILLAHLQQLSNEISLAPLLKKVDIIISGGNHDVTADGNDRLISGHTRVRPYPIVTTNADGDPLAILNNTSDWKYVARFVCDFDSTGKLLVNKLDSTVNGMYASDSTTLINLYGTYGSAFKSDSKGAYAKVICDSVASVIRLKDGNIFGKTNVFLEGRRAVIRTEETNFGNLTAEANLAYAKIADSTVRVSIKNGGGIRSAIGEVNAVGSNVTYTPPSANLSAGKQAGSISQLDIEGALRFNNKLSIVSLTAKNFKTILEHGVAATTSGATPGQFPQVSGVKFSFDVTGSSNNKIRSASIVDSIGNIVDILVADGKLIGNPNRIIRVVTLDFLASGGDNYPFNTLATNRVNLDTAKAIKNATGVASFSALGTEQDAFAEYMKTKYSTTPYNTSEKAVTLDNRIQQKQFRLDSVLLCSKPKNPKHFHLDDEKLSCNDSTLQSKNSLSRAYKFVNWSTGDKTIKTTVPSAGLYWVYESSNDYCNIDTINVVFVSRLISQAKDTSLCNVQSNSTLKLDLVKWFGKTDFDYYNNGKIKVTTADILVKNSTTRKWKGYAALKTNTSVKCAISGDVYPTVVYPRLVGKTKDTIVTNKFALKPFIVDKTYNKYNWSNGDTTFSTSIKNSGQYWFKHSSNRGCTQTDTFHFSVINLKVPSQVSAKIGSKITLKVADSSNSTSYVVWSTGDTGWHVSYNVTKNVEAVFATQKDGYQSVIKAVVVYGKSEPIKLKDENQFDDSLAQKNSLEVSVVSNADIKLYPNPVGSVIVIEGLTGQLNYEIHSITGKLVQTGKATSRINVENLQSGIYTLKLDNISVKFIKE